MRFVWVKIALHYEISGSFQEGAGKTILRPAEVSKYLIREYSAATRRRDIKCVELTRQWKLLNRFR
jgi:hypothetical protein